MKNKIAITAAVLLILSSLAGCAAGAADPVPSAATEALAETIPPETAASTAAQPETEALTEETEPFWWRLRR